MTVSTHKFQTTKREFIKQKIWNKSIKIMRLKKKYNKSQNKRNK